MKFEKREVASGDGGNTYLKLKDGESKTGIFRGEIFEHFIRWENNKSIETKAGEPGAKSRFKINFVTFEDGKFVAKVWEISTTVYNLLGSIHEEYPLETTKVKITRQGTGTDTIYHILPLLKDPVSPQVLKQIEAVKLNILDVPMKSKPQVLEHDGFGPMPDAADFQEPSSELPF